MESSESGKKECYPSTITYIAQLMLNRYAMLGILNHRGHPVKAMGVLGAPETVRGGIAATNLPIYGAPCNECGNLAVIKKDGCRFCTSCGMDCGCG